MTKLVSEHPFLEGGHYWVMPMRMTNVLLGIKGDLREAVARKDIYRANYCHA